MSEIPQPLREAEDLPLLPVRDAVTFPGEIVQLAVGRTSTTQMLASLTDADHRAVLVAQRDPGTAEPGLADLHPVGTLSVILRLGRPPSGTSLLVVAEGLQRVRLVSAGSEKPYLRARVEPLADVPSPDDAELAALTRSVRDIFSDIVMRSPHLPAEVVEMVSGISDPSALADFVAARLRWLPVATRQELLEAVDVRARLEHLTRILGKEAEGLKLEGKIHTAIRQRFAAEQREVFLREQMKQIQRELGERDPEARALDELRDRLEKLPLPDEARAEVERELRRLQGLHTASAEWGVLRTWLDLFASLPWGKPTQHPIDVARAREILDEDHEDLRRVKERIVEFLAVQKLRPAGRSPILCFLGPPGVGKTSLGRSIARATGRTFVRVSLGGTHDEAEIRGHRRTYVGALPGQIILGMRRAGSIDPVFMLDEIDKLGRDTFHGDPSAALLEALDPEQNAAFRDHYLDVPFDLSRVLFITTANTLDTVPPTLLDRMEVLELPGYSEEEKLQIARRHLLPRQVLENGLDDGRIRFSDEALLELVRSYTREAGVRNLERALGRICRKHACTVAAGDAPLLLVTPEVVRRLLGPEPFRTETEVAGRTSTPGVALGLAWTPQGGDVIFVEGTLLPRGRGEFLVTGQIGEVMQESMRAALSWLRAHALSLGIDPLEFKRNDVHLHVPAGAVRKDGPSAGAAIAAALASLFTGVPVRPLLALTGEITLKGLLLPVGGLKEKVLAARRSGVKEIVLPAENEPQLVDEVAEELRAGIRFHFVRDLDEALEYALGRRERPAAAGAGASA